MSLLCVATYIYIFGGVRGQSVCFVCGKIYSGGEGTECLFCVWYKTFGGVKGQSVCFVCGTRYFYGVGGQSVRFVCGIKYVGE